MNRLVFILLGLLVITNLAWILTQGPDHEASPSEPRDEPRHEPRGTTPGNDGPGVAPGEARRPRPDSEMLAGKKLLARGEAPVDPLKVRKRREHLTREIVQREDPERRRRAEGELVLALQHGEPEELLAALQTVPWVKSMEIDRALLRPLLEARIFDPDPRVRKGAIVALTELDPRPEDLLSLIALVNDPSRDVRRELPAAIGRTNRWEIVDAAGFAFIDLLNDVDRSVQIATLAAMHHATWLSDELIRAVMPLRSSKVRATSLRALNALSGPDLPKGDRIVDVMLTALTHADPEFRSAGRDGLTHGVPPASHKAVLEILIPALRTQKELEDRQENLRLLALYGNGDHLKMLDRMAADADLPDLIRRTARKTATAIRTREKR